MKASLSLTLLCTLVWFAQGLAQNSPVASGADISGSGIKVSYSVGQVVTQNGSANGVSYSPGVQQTYIITTSLDDPQNPKLQVKVYPNPTVDELIISVEDDFEEELNCKLYDTHGKILMQTNLFNETTLRTSELPASNYVLNILRGNSIIRSFQIIKN